MSVNMDNNFCTSCGELIPDGVQVCGRCLKKNDGPAYHQAVRVLIRHCKQHYEAHKSCEGCVLRHHCQNTISNWPELMLPTDMADYEEVELPKARQAVQKKKSKISKWLSKNFGYVYIAVAVIFGLIIFGIGLVVGQAVDYYQDKSEATQAVVEQSKTAVEETYWFIETDGGDING